MKLTAALPAMLLLAAATLPVQAQELLTGTNLDEILEAANELGTASIEEQSNGDPMIEGSLDGLRYQIFFRNCTRNADCEDLNFYAGFEHKPDLATINEWNQAKRFSRAYLDNVDDAVVEMDIDMVQGVTADYLASQLDIWAMIVPQFAEHIGY